MTQVNDRSLKLKDLFSVMVGCNKSTYMINFCVWNGHQCLHLSVCMSETGPLVIFAVLEEEHLRLGNSHSTGIPLKMVKIYGSD